MKKSDKAGAQQPNLFLSGSTTQKNNVLSLADPEQFGRPLCDVSLFQTRTIPSPLATRTERDDASEIQTPSDLGTSSVSSAGTESSAFSWSRGSSKRKRHDGSKHGRHQQSPVPLSQSPCCTSCYVTETPKWRKGPLGPYTLCNVCGLLYAKKERKARSCRLRKEYSHNSFRDQTSDTS